MSYGYNSSNQNSLDFREIVLTHLKRILEISSHELRASEKILVLDNTKSYVESEDTRVSYLQSVENLAYVLIPYFDDKMQKTFDKEIIFLQGFPYEIIEEVKDEELKKRLDNKDGKEKTDLLTMIQIKHAKVLFVELNRLLKRVDYLKSGIFGESGGDDVVEDED